MFYSYLEENKMRSILNFVEFSYPTFSQEDRVFAFLDEIRNNENARVYGYGDYDVDGAMCAKVIETFLEKLGVKDFTMFEYKNRTHSLDGSAVNECINGKFNYMIIGDTASQDLQVLKYLVGNGVKVLIMDHHVTSFNYDDFPEGVVIVNTTLENEILEKDEYELSAGALCFCVLDKYLKSIDLEDKSMYAYALTSLYADCMEMGNKLNRSIYWAAIGLERDELPKEITAFLNEYTIFGRRYIDFWFSPRINALFRSEQFKVLNAFLFHSDNQAKTAACIDLINKIYKSNREMIGVISDVLQSDVEDMKNFVVCNMNLINEYKNVEEYKLYNYTGLIANTLTDKFEKPAIVYCEQGSKIKGSVRDKFSRDILSIFQYLCDAGGHPPAFGFYVNKFDFPRFLRMIHMMDKDLVLDNAVSSPIIEQIGAVNPDSAMIDDMALYNDFSGGKLPVAFIRKQYIGNITEKYSKYYHELKWGEYRIQSQESLVFGQNMILKPTKKKSVVLIK
jgi:single-stranded-DNA-specific exonuclease